MQNIIPHFAVGSSSLANAFNEWTEFFLSHWKRLVAKVNLIQF